MVVANLSDCPQVTEDWVRLEADQHFAPRASQLEMMVWSSGFPPESVRSQTGKGSLCTLYREVNTGSRFISAERAGGGNTEISNSRKLFLPLSLEDQREVVDVQSPGIRTV